MSASFKLLERAEKILTEEKRLLKDLLKQQKTNQLSKHLNITLVLLEHSLDQLLPQFRKNINSC